MNSKLRAAILLGALSGLLPSATAQTVLFDFETGDQGWGSFGTITTDSGLTIGSSGQGRFHVGDFTADDVDPDNPLLWGIVDVSPLGVDLAPHLGFTVDALLRSVPNPIFPEYTGEKILDIGVEVAGVEYYAAPVTMTDEFQTFSVRFSEFVPGNVDLSSSRIKLRVLSSHGMGIGELDYDQVTGVDPRSGDFDGNGVFQCADVDALVAEIAAGTNAALYDLDIDGLVTDSDLTIWLAQAGAANLDSGNSYLVGDANLDGVVDTSDFNAWNSNKFTPTAAWCSGDFNAEGFVDISDFNLWNSNKFTSADASGGVVPEPSSGCLALWLLLTPWCRGARGRVRAAISGSLDEEQLDDSYR